MKRRTSLSAGDTSFTPRCAGLCHTEIDEGGVYRDDRYLAGGMRVGALPQGVFVSRNLTSDPDTGLGRASVSEIADAIRNGRGLDGQTLNFWGMPWMYLHRLSEDDARAIATYLKTLPPQRNAIPNPLHYRLRRNDRAQAGRRPISGRASRSPHL